MRKTLKFLMKEMNVEIELTVNCEEIEEMLRSQYNLDEPVKLTRMEHDELSDVCAFTFEVDADDSKQICRNWDSSAFTTGLLEEAI
jgi:hypothetical protein